MNEKSNRIEDAKPSDLDDLFALARENQPVMTSDLLNHIVSDAARLQPVTEIPAPQTETFLGRLRSALHMIGGWPAMTAMTTAAVAGLWIGFNPPTFFMGQTAVSYNETDLYLSDLFADLSFTPEDM